MEWQLVLVLIIGSLVILMALGLPVAFCFMLVNLVAAFFIWGGTVGLEQLILSIAQSVNTFTLLPIPLFVLMGEVMFHSGIAPRMIDSVDKLLGRLPGRLGLLAVGSATLMSTLTGTSLATTALLGTVLVPEMEKRGYKKPMSLGPILGSGGLAIMIPPSGVAVVLGAIGEISIGRILIAIIIPGLLLATLYVVYIIVRCTLQPSVAPAYAVPHIPIQEKIKAIVIYVLPLAFIVFLVIGFIFLGVATPSEAAATGAIGTFILAAAYRRLNWEVVKKSVLGTVSVTGMIFIIMSAAKAFSQIMTFSGATRGLIGLATGLPLAPIYILISMQIVLLIMGCFMDAFSIMMVTLPLFMPVVHALGFNPVWFAVIFMLNMEMGGITPPFGVGLFVMKGVAPPDTTMEHIYKAALPFLGLALIAMILIIIFPALALWLPGLMR